MQVHVWNGLHINKQTDRCTDRDGQTEMHTESSSRLVQASLGGVPVTDASHGPLTKRHAEKTDTDTMDYRYGTRHIPTDTDTVLQKDEATD